MTAAPELSANERARVAAFDAAPQLAESAPMTRAVLALHRPVSQNQFAAYPVKDPVDVCAHCNTHTYPCPTVQAVAAVLATDPEPRDAVIERMARAIFETQYPGYAWPEAPGQVRHDIRRLAAAALDASRGGTQ